MSTLTSSTQQLEEARAQLKLRQLQVQQNRQYVALLDRLHVASAMQKNELALLQGEMERWELLYHRISKTIASYKMRGEPD